MENQNPLSIYIARILPGVKEDTIRQVLENFGEINDINIIPKKTSRGENFNSVIVNFRRWYDNKSRERLLSGKDIKIIYDDPWFWKISAINNSFNIKSNAKNISEQVREDSEIEHQNFVNERLIQNRCKNCNRQRFGRFDTCCQACLSGSHTADCDKRNRITTPYYMKKGGKRKGRKTNKKRTRKNKSRKFGK